MTDKRRTEPVETRTPVPLAAYRLLDKRNTEIREKLKVM